MTQKHKKDGFVALACSNLDDVIPMSSWLLFKTNTSNQAILRLKFGHKDALTYLLQINPSNLVIGKNFLTPAKMALPQKRLDKIQRHGNPNVRSLSLTLDPYQRCSIWYPKSETAPKAGLDPLLDQVASLATAPQLHLLFDLNWLGLEQTDSFQEFIRHPENFSSFPVDSHYSLKYERLNWALFNAPAYCGPTTEETCPAPEYPLAPVKRPRRASTPTPSPPQTKRPLTSSHFESLHASPTEEHSTATPHPQPQHISAASPSPSPGVLVSDIQRAVEDAIELALPRMLNDHLPPILTQLATADSPTPSPRSTASPKSTVSPPPKLTAFGKTLGKYVKRKIESEIEGIYDHTLRHASFLRDTANDQLYETLDEEKLALDRTAEAKFEDFKQQCEDLEEDIVERVSWRLEKYYEGLEQHLRDAGVEGTVSQAQLRAGRVELSVKRADLGMQQEQLQQERAVFNLEKADLRREKAELRKEKEEWRRMKLLDKEKDEAIGRGEEGGGWTRRRMRQLNEETNEAVG